MSSIPERSSTDAQKRAKGRLLHNGDKLKQEQFHRLYEQMPTDYRAELIGGLVFEPSPLGYPHGNHHAHLACLVDTYATYTPGTGVADNATVILSAEDEVQPDLVLRIEKRGSSLINNKNYIQGAPELVAEVAHSSCAIDLHLKKKRYALAGVEEYIILCLEPMQLHWINLRSGDELKCDDFGICRSVVFPGLWIHARALLDGNRVLSLETVNEGLRSQEHADFVTALQSRN